MTVDELKPIIESLIYVSEEPISVKQLATLLEGESVQDIQTATEAYERVIERWRIAHRVESAN